MVGGNGGREEVNAYVADADVVLFVGTRANATDTNSFRSPPRTASVFVLDVEARADVGAVRNYPGAMALAGDARATLEQLLGHLTGPAPVERAERAARVAAVRDTRPAVPTSALPPDTLSARDVLRAVLSAVPDAVVVADCGTPTPLLAADHVLRSAGRSIIVARGHGPMGYAIPAAVGAALAHPGRRVVCLTTDGSFTMACGELATAAARALDITFVQLTNGSFGWIKMLQHLYYDRRYFGVDLHPVDSVAVARGFGVPAHRVTSLADLGDLVTEQTRGPLYLDVPIPEQLTEVPPVSSWQAALRGDRTRPVY